MPDSRKRARECNSGLERRQVESPSKEFSYQRTNRSSKNLGGSPRNSEDLWDRSPFTKRIEEIEIPGSLWVIPDLKKFDGTGNPDTHLDHFYQVMNDRHVPDQLMCKIFPFTLEGWALSWFKGLSPNSIYAWGQLEELFAARFDKSHMWRDPWEMLSAVRQRDHEALRDYLDRYGAKAKAFQNLDPREELFWLIQGLNKESQFRRDVMIDNPRTLDEFYLKAQEYIDYEEIRMANMRQFRLRQSQRFEGERRGVETMMGHRSPRKGKAPAGKVARRQIDDYETSDNEESSEAEREYESLGKEGNSCQEEKMLEDCPADKPRQQRTKRANSRNRAACKPMSYARGVPAKPSCPAYRIV